MATKAAEAALDLAAQREQLLEAGVNGAKSLDDKQIAAWLKKNKGKLPVKPAVSAGSIM